MIPIHPVRKKSISDTQKNQPLALAIGIFAVVTFPPMTTKTRITLLAATLTSLFLSACADLNATSKTQSTDSDWTVRRTEHGKASWYSIKTNYGTRTASGERLSNTASTAAHKTLPMGTRVRVTNLANGKSEIVRITDRGPYIRGRIIDVTVGCAQRIGFYSRGVAAVKVEVLDRKTPETASEPKVAQN